jgi:GNAT superfamily N-acetyltransferase
MRSSNPRTLIFSLSHSAGRIAELIEDWKFMFWHDGTFHALPSIGLEIAGLFYRHVRFLVIARSLIDPFPNFRPTLSLEIRPFEQADLKIVRDVSRPSEAKQCARRLERGHQGLIALNRSNLAGYAWGYTELHPQLERVAIELEPGDVLCNDVYTNPIYRGKGVQTALTLARFKLFRNLGFRRAICYIETNNIPSLNVWQRKLGGMTIGSIDFMRIGPWYQVRSYKATLSESSPVGKMV